MSYIDYLLEYYFLIIVIIIVLVLAVIGYLVDSNRNDEPKQKVKSKDKNEPINDEIQKLEPTNLNLGTPNLTQNQTLNNEGRMESEIQPSKIDEVPTNVL